MDDTLIITGSSPSLDAGAIAPGGELTVTDALTELAEIEAESMGWLPLGEGSYLHLGATDEDEPVIYVVGMPDVGMAGMNVLLLGS